MKLNEKRERFFFGFLQSSNYMFPLTLLIIELVLDSRITTLKRKCRPTCDSNTVINCSYFTDVQYIIVYLYIQLVLFIEIFTFFFFFFQQPKVIQIQNEYIC